ncbi:MAG: hypothetical protein AAF747_03815 [Planctomycetota bacterium]
MTETPTILVPEAGSDRLAPVLGTADPVRIAALPLLDAQPAANSGPVLVRSGTLGEPGDPVAEMRTWGPEGWEALTSAVKQALSAGVELLVQPNAFDVLSDAQRCLGLINDIDGARVLLDPASMLTASMLNHADDHIRRAFESLAAHPGTVAVRLADVEPDASDTDGRRLLTKPLGTGVLDVAAVASLVKKHSVTDRPIVLSRDHWQREAESLGILP